MGPSKAKIKRDVHLRIDHGPKPSDFHYHATCNEKPIDDPKHLKLDHGDTVTFESPNSFSLRFVKSPFKEPQKTVLQATSAGDGWTLPATVRDQVKYGEWYHYTVVMGDFSTDDPEIIIEQVNT